MHANLDLPVHVPKAPMLEIVTNSLILGEGYSHLPEDFRFITFSPETQYPET